MNNPNDGEIPIQIALLLSVLIVMALMMTMLTAELEPPVYGAQKLYGKTFTEKQYVLSLIRHYSSIYNTEFALVEKVARCESGLRPTASNSSSTAGGVYQFLDSTFAGNCYGEKYNAEDNIRCGVRMISEGGIGHWYASRSCWE